MPFQVSLCAIVSNSLVTVSIRPDVTSPCIVSLDLIATVTSGNANGHTYLWEQISGGQVVFTTPANQLVATVTLLDSTNKVFYFWVDKNTAAQQQYVFNYNGTATETTSFPGGNTIVKSNGLLIGGGSPSCASIIGIQAIFNTGVQTSAAVINPSNIILRWDLPTTISGLQNIYVEQNINGVWTTVTTLLPTDPQLLSGAIQNTLYRIKTVYLIDNKLYSQYSCVYTLVVDIVDYNGYVDEVFPAVGGSTLANTIITNYTLLSTDSITNEIIDIIPYSGGNTMQSVSYTLYTLLSTDSITNEIIDIMPYSGGNTIIELNVSYYGGVVIGG